MKKILYYILITMLAGFTFAGCKKDNSPIDEGEEESAIVVQNEQALNQTVYADAIKGDSLQFTTTGAWTSEITETTATRGVAPEWISINPVSGDNAGNHGFAINLEENTSGADRSATITVSSGGDDAEIKVTQKSTTKDGKPYEKKYDIYVGGAYIQGSSYTGSSGYYKNGVWKDVGLKYVNPENGKVTDIAVVGNSVYIVGILRDDGVSAHYWKDGAVISLPITQRENYATGIAVQTTVDKTDVYISGYEIVPGDITVAKYWKNNVVYLLGDGVKSSYAYDIAVSGDDVYVMGRNGVGRNGDDWGYWKNGQFTKLSGTNITYQPSNIVVSGHDVYIAGAGTLSNGIAIVGYWKNGQLVVLEEYDRVYADDWAYDIAVSGNDIYVVGSETEKNLESHAVFWKNGVKTFLDSDNYSSVAKGITIVDKDVYIVVETFGNIYTPRDIYKNGVKIDSWYNIGNIRDIEVVPYSPTRQW